MKTETDLAVVGGGPAGLSAASTAARLGLRVTLIDDNPLLGGQLVKQTHKFFGSKSHYCGTRGTDIARLLAAEVEDAGVDVRLNTSAVGCYSQRVLLLAGPQRADKLVWRNLIVAAGAAENALLFENNDLPGVYGAGAVQTLMNVFGVRPGRRVLMVGSGNVGLIVSYQLIQAGVEVIALVEALPRIGGYHVHAAKLVRLGVPILTSHTIRAAIGRDGVDGAIICRVDSRLRPVKGTDRRLRLDTICVAVGLTPLIELLRQLGCHIVWVPELGGNVAWHDSQMQTSISGVYVAGDASGIEEASTALLEGRIAGAHAAISLLGESTQAERIVRESQKELCAIREGPFGEKAACGKQELARCRVTDSMS
uniref:FAD-dependent oxidoreductase n=1 Tax=candidate division WOR-3 bacterium TaxID=2052148 RepID=A0A7C4CAM3_UNCW3